MKKGFRILKFKKDSPIFEIQDISKSFNGRPVLKKLSLKVYPGECVGILGPNGCGKTTLFSMCIGELSPDNGKIFLRNKLLFTGISTYLDVPELALNTGIPPVVSSANRTPFGKYARRIKNLFLLLL